MIIGGSPCQDLSVAGQRAGLDGERSGLFMEQIRIIKEMRDADLRNSGRHDYQGVGGSISHAETFDDSGRQRELHSDNTGGITDESDTWPTRSIRPRYMVWENVPGAFSSNKGEDFRVVLEETAKIADEATVIPQPAKGKWTNSGAIMGDGWSIAWRVFDAQFWGVPQRRRRIALVADFGGQSAPEILFEREGVSGDIAESGAEGQGVAGGVESGIGKAIGFDGYNAQVTGDKSATLGVNCGISTGRNGVIESVDGGVGAAGFLSTQGSKAMGIGFAMEQSPTLRAGLSGADVIILNDQGGSSINIESETLSPTLRANSHQHEPVITFAQNQREEVRDLGDKAGALAAEAGVHQQTYVAQPVIALQGNGIDRADTAGCNGKGWREDVCYTLNTIDRPAVFSFDSLSSNSMKSSNPHSGCRQVEIAKCIDTTNPDPSKNQGGMAVDCRNGTAYTANQFANHTEGVGTLRANGGDLGGGSESLVASQSVRRLTPLECERLQGYEDGWTNIPPQTEVTADDLSFWRTVWNEWQAINGAKPKTDKQIIKWLQSEAADSARYKALGNSIALPPWRFVLSRIHKQGARTMASLFDGIGGFPKVWNELGGQILWASEVEPFPILVTRYHFKEVQNG